MTSDMPVFEKCPFFEHFKPKHLEKLSALCSLVHFSKGEIIFQEGDDDTQFYVLVSGKVALEFCSAGRRFLLTLSMPGMSSAGRLSLGKRSSSAPGRLEPAEASAFEVADLRAALDANPYLAQAFLERLSGLIAQRLQNTRRQLGRTLAKAREPAKSCG